MKKILQLILVIGIAALASGCATPYMVDRGRDAADIFTVSFERGLGAKARVGPVAVGLGATCGSSGLRGGTVIHEPEAVPVFNSDCPLSRGAWDWSLLGFGNHEACISEKLRARDKSFLAGGEFGPTWTIPFLQLESFHKAEYYTQIEASVALYGGLRLGFNPGELLDFILGCTTIDIFNDDLEWKKRKSNQTLEPIRHSAPEGSR